MICQKFDLVIALDDNNLKDLKNLGCKISKTWRFLDMEEAVFSDPYYFRDFEEFKNVYSMIETIICYNFN